MFVLILQLTRSLSLFQRSILSNLVLVLTLLISAIPLAAQNHVDILKLELGKPIERELIGDQAHSYRIELAASQYLHVIVDQRGVDVVVGVFGPDGKKLAGVDSPNGTQGPEPVSIIAQIPGTYRLEIRSLEKGAPPGRYEVKIEELRAATQHDRSRIAAEQAFSQAELLRGQGTTESLQSALKKYEESLVLFRVLADKPSEAAALLAIGRVYEISGDKRTASETYQLALPIFKAVGDRRHEAITLNNIGAMLTDLGDSREAIKYYVQALPIIRALEDGRTEAMILGNLGSSHSALGDRKKALEYFLQVLPVMRDIGDRRIEAALLNDIGGLYDDLGNEATALEYFLQALSIFREIGDQRSEAAMLTNLGGVYTDLGDKHRALDFLDRALGLYKSFKNIFGEATTLHNIGGVYDRLADWQKSLEYYRLALPLRKASGDKRGEAWTLNGIGSAYARLGDRQKALDYYKQALLLWETVDDPGGEAQTLGSLMSVYASLNNPRSAIFYGKQAVNVYQLLRSNIRSLVRDIQKTYLTSVERTYRGLADLLITHGRLTEAQQVLNAFKDQQFFDVSQSGAKPLRPLTDTPREAEFVARYERLHNGLSSIGGKVGEHKRKLGSRQPNDEETRQLQQLEAQLKALSDEFSTLIKQVETQFAEPPDTQDTIVSVPDAIEMQAALQQLNRETRHETVAIYTLIGTDTFHALIVTDKGIASVSTKVKSAEFNEKALQLWALLQSAAYDPTELANELYNIIFKPIEGELPKDTQTIIWSLDRNLRYLPMAALYDGKRYLVERYNHVVFTRAGKERLTRAASPTWIGYGFATSLPHAVEVDGRLISFGPLGFANDEMQIFRTKTYPHGIIDAEVLSETQFTKASLLATLKQKRPLVHISSHFRFRPGDASESFLLLGDGQIMTLAEMNNQTNLFQSVELLTLSACDTAAQRPDATGREIDAFAELAQRLGANGVMASLWSVLDRSTAQLMKGFYNNRQGGKYSKAEALRQAQLDLLYGRNGAFPTPNAGKNPAIAATKGNKTADEDIVVEPKYRTGFRIDRKRPFAHPYYWSPFVLFGNWK